MSNNGTDVLGGNVAVFRIWDTAKTLAELNIITCEDKGNVANMADFSTQGSPTITKNSATCFSKYGSLQYILFGN